jgi:hypothetical protein
MANHKLSLFYVALAALALTLAAFSNNPAPRDFGDVDPQYRSAFSNTAWFLHQRGDTNSPADDPELAPARALPVEPTVAEAR